MNLQLDTNEYYREFSTKKHSIGMAFSNRGDKYLPYIRRYGKLNKEELLYLINVAKENSWTALDLSNCAIEELPEELWEITSLKLLYLEIGIKEIMPTSLLLLHRNSKTGESGSFIY